VQIVHLLSVRLGGSWDRFGHLKHMIAENSKARSSLVLLDGYRDEALAAENLLLSFGVKPHAKDDILLRPLVLSGPLNRHYWTTGFQLHLIAGLKFHAYLLVLTRLLYCCTVAMCARGIFYPP
jgi:hypothetical protein